jgi:hypothetical protein
MYLRSANLVEYNKDEGLDKPGERQIFLSSSKQQPRTQRQAHLGYETGHRRTQHTAPHGTCDGRGGRGGGRGRIYEVGQVEVGREIMSMIKPAQMVEV